MAAWVGLRAALTSIATAMPGATCSPMAFVAAAPFLHPSLIGSQDGKTTLGHVAINMAKRKKRGKEGQDSLPVADLPRTAARPKLVVFDLGKENAWKRAAFAQSFGEKCLTQTLGMSADNTLWSPELYQLRRSPKAERDIWLFEGAKAALMELASGRPEWSETRVALASRTGLSLFVSVSLSVCVISVSLTYSIAQVRSSGPFNSSQSSRQHRARLWILSREDCSRFSRVRNGSTLSVSRQIAVCLSLR